jgi:hypothetical protein
MKVGDKVRRHKTQKVYEITEIDGGWCRGTYEGGGFNYSLERMAQDFELITSVDEGLPETRVGRHTCRFVDNGFSKYNYCVHEGCDKKEWGGF